MTDIVERLRTLGNAPFLEEAADEIERLRKEIAALRRHPRREREIDIIIIKGEGLQDATIIYKDED